MSCSCCHIKLWFNHGSKLSTFEFSSQGSHHQRLRLCTFLDIIIIRPTLPRTGSMNCSFFSHLTDVSLHAFCLWHPITLARVKQTPTCSRQHLFANTRPLNEKVVRAHCRYITMRKVTSWPHHHFNKPMHVTTSTIKFVHCITPSLYSYNSTISTSRIRVPSVHCANLHCPPPYSWLRVCRREAFLGLWDKGCFVERNRSEGPGYRSTRARQVLVLSLKHLPHWVLKAPLRSDVTLLCLLLHYFVRHIDVLHSTTHIRLVNELQRGWVVLVKGHLLLREA